MAELELFTTFNSSLSSAQITATLRTAKELQRKLESSMVSMDEAHQERVMKIDLGSGEAFQAETLIAHS